MWLNRGRDNPRWARNITTTASTLLPFGFRRGASVSALNLVDWATDLLPRDKPISLLSIASSTSVACEQLFSAAGQIYADRRGNLHGENFMLRNFYISHTIVVYSGSTVSSFSDYVLYILS